MQTRPILTLGATRAPANRKLPERPPRRQWVIWRRQGSRPKVRHQSLKGALDEVARLRREFPEQRYDIFELVPLRETGPRR
jgi:hypothetical protein